MNRAELDAILTDLRQGALREIGPKVAKLRPQQARVVSTAVCRQLERTVSDGGLDHTHRWLVTALQFLAPPDAGDLVARALRRSVRLRNCCGCVRNRLMRAAGAIRPPQAVPALVDIICQVDNPAHKQLAAVCIHKIVRARGDEAAALARSQSARRRRALVRVKKALSSTPRVTPLKPWVHVPGSPGWCAAMGRAIKAIERSLDVGGRSSGGVRPLRRRPPRCR